MNSPAFDQAEFTVPGVNSPMWSQLQMHKVIGYPHDSHATNASVAVSLSLCSLEGAA